MSSTERVSFRPSLEKESNISLYQTAVSLIHQLKGAGFDAYFVGGAVRDMVLKRPLKDIDIATNASIDELKILFPHAILVGAQFGILRVIRKSFEFEIASFRTEGDYRDGRHPSRVEKAFTFEEDAQRRDFTINGLFYDPIEETILDCVQGLHDIEIKVLRTIGPAYERFQEDRLRVLRALRFSHALSFPIQEETYAAMKEFASSVPLHVSGERIWDELSKMNSLGVLKEAFFSMVPLGLMQAIFPCFTSDREERIALLERGSFALPVALSLLFYDEIPFSDWAMERFHIAHDERLVMEQFQIMYRGFIEADVPELKMVDLLALSYSDSLLPSLSLLMPSGWLEKINKKRIELLPWIEQRRSKKYIVTGQLLIQNGIPPGKNVGLLMEKAFLLSLKTRSLNQEKLLWEVLHAV